MGDDAVFTSAEAFARVHAAGAEQRRLFELAFAVRRAQLREQARAPDDIDSIYVPRWVCVAAGGADAHGQALAAATALLWVGIDLLDDVMDGDPLPDSITPAALSLTAITLICALAPLAVSLLPASPATLLTMQRALARGLLAMSAGQQRDVSLRRDAHPTSAGAMEAATGKTGAGVALLAELGARLAGADGAHLAAYREMGQALGTACQLHSDIFDLFAAPHSKDLANGTRTFPIAWYAERLAATPARRDGFIALLDHARTEPAAQTAARAELKESGAVQATVFVIERYCARAREALARAKPCEPAGAALRRRIDAMSFAEGSQTEEERLHDDRERKARGHV